MSMAARRLGRGRAAASAPRTNSGSTDTPSPQATAELEGCSSGPPRAASPSPRSAGRGTVASVMAAPLVGLSQNRVVVRCGRRPIVLLTEQGFACGLRSVQREHVGGDGAAKELGDVGRNRHRAVKTADLANGAVHESKLDRPVASSLSTSEATSDRRSVRHPHGQRLGTRHRAQRGSGGLYLPLPLRHLSLELGQRGLV